MENIKEFKKLKQRYETITLKEIKEAFKTTPKSYKVKLTGFGKCVVLKKNNSNYWHNCNKCIYSKYNGCIENYGLKTTFNLINTANTPEQLLSAYRQRAIAMGKYAKRKNINLD